MDRELKGNISEVSGLEVLERRTIDLITLGRVNAFSQMLHNSARKLFFSEPAGYLGEGRIKFQPSGKRDYSRVSERLLLNTPGGYSMGQEKDEASEDDQDLKLCSS